MINVRELHDSNRCRCCIHFRAEFVIGSDGLDHIAYSCEKKAFSGHEKDCPSFEHIGGDK